MHILVSDDNHIQTNDAGHTLRVQPLINHNPFSSLFDRSRRLIGIPWNLELTAKLGIFRCVRVSPIALSFISLIFERT